MKPIFVEPEKPYLIESEHRIVSLDSDQGIINTSNDTINLSSVTHLLKMVDIEILSAYGTQGPDPYSITFFFIGGSYNSWVYPDKESRDKEYKRLMEKYKDD